MEMSGCDGMALTAEDDHKNEMRKCSVRDVSDERDQGWAGY